MAESQPRVLAMFIFVASLIPLGDLFNVYAQVKSKNIPAILI